MRSSAPSLAAPAARGVSLAGLAGAAANLGLVALLVCPLLTVGMPFLPVWTHVLVVATALAGLRACAPSRAHFRAWATWAVGFVLFVHLRALADETGLAARFAYVVDVERWLFGGVVPTLWLQGRLYTPGSPSVLDAYCIAVHVSYFFAPQLLAVALWRGDLPRFRLFVAAALGTFGAGLAVHALVPTAPPWLAGQSGTLPHVYRVLTDVLTGIDAETYRRGYEVAGTNPVAAMPSLHMAITWLIAVVAWRTRRAAGVVAALYAASMAFTLVYLGEHYVADLLAGILIAQAAWCAATVYARARPS